MAAKRAGIDMKIASLTIPVPLRKPEAER